MTSAFINADQSARGILNAALAQYGLGSLAKWAWSQYTAGSSTDQIMLDLRNQPEYKARFPAMEELAKQGHAMSESQYITMENGYATAMHNAGLPPGFYDQPEDYAQLMENNVSVGELQNRVTNGFARVASAPPEVRAEFEKLYGAKGDSALAAWFLDPDKAEPVLEQQAAAAVIGGTGMRYGVDTGKGTLEELAQQGVTDQQAQTGFAAIQKSAGLFHANEGENPDLTEANQGVSAQFGLSANDILAVQQRQQERQAAFQGSGAAAATAKGAVGLGEAGQPT